MKQNLLKTMFLAVALVGATGGGMRKMLKQHL